MPLWLTNVSSDSRSEAMFVFKVILCYVLLEEGEVTRTNYFEESWSITLIP
jgi:hypothetical protein